MTTKNVWPRVIGIIREARGPISRKSIVEELNKGNLPKSNLNDVGVAISRIRGNFGEEAIITTDKGYVDGLWHVTSNDHGRKK